MPEDFFPGTICETTVDDKYLLYNNLNRNLGVNGKLVYQKSALPMCMSKKNNTQIRPNSVIRPIRDGHGPDGACSICKGNTFSRAHPVHVKEYSTYL